MAENGFEHQDGQCPYRFPEAPGYFSFGQCHDEGENDGGKQQVPFGTKRPVYNRNDSREENDEGYPILLAAWRRGAS